MMREEATVQRVASTAVKVPFSFITCIEDENVTLKAAAIASPPSLCPFDMFAYCHVLILRLSLVN
jgi:hypothetical protein